MDSHNTGANAYMFPNDGYVNFKAETASSGYFEVAIVDSNGNNLAYENEQIQGAYQSNSFYVRKGTYCIVMTLATDAHIYYVPFVN